MASREILKLGATELRIDGHLLKTARLRDEYYVAAADPPSLISGLRDLHAGADIFTFVQELHDRDVHFGYHLEWDKMAVLPLTTYANWFDKQIKFKPRNKLRKAWKSGVETRVQGLTDELVRGIREIYNETPLRQGKRNWHYGKDFDTVKREHSTFLERSEFIGAYIEDELIGFAKITHGEKYSILMNIVAKVSQRERAPMNALIAKTVELVAGRKIPLLNYGVWGRRGLNDFKVANAFECMEVPRYYVPLTFEGAIALKLNLHRGLKERMPEAWIVKLADTRGRWNTWRYGSLSPLRPVRVRPAEAGPSSPGER